MVASSPNEADRVTRRTIGFMHHLRLNDFPVGPAETQMTLKALKIADLSDRDSVRLGLKTLLATGPERWQQFDGLFEAYWFKRGRERAKSISSAKPESERPAEIWQGHLGRGATRAGYSGGPAAAAPTSHRIATSFEDSLAKTDLRHIADPEEIAAAERLALKLAHAMAYRLSRRFRADAGNDRLDLRRTIYHSISHGGEPIDLAFRKRPDRPVEIVFMLDVSGSMKPYTRFFLQFLKGLVSGWKDTDAYLIHTRLVRITDALRERDPANAMMRLALMAEGFGGGTRLGECLALFNTKYAKSSLSSRSIFIIVSDGYDTGTPARLAAELGRLKRRVRRLVWLNPLLGWQGYEPIARAMAAALPYIDHFAAAYSLETLAAIENDLRAL